MGKKLIGVGDGCAVPNPGFGRAQLDPTQESVHA